MRHILLFLIVSSCAASAPREPSLVRAEATRAQLATTEGGRLLGQVIAAHGGLDRWYAVDTLRFTFDYRPPGKPEARRHTVNTVHVPTSRVRQEQVGGEAVLGWDGEQAWIAPDASAFPSPARFWALTPYYFVGMPFVLADPGTVHERLADGELDGSPVERVKVRFEAGTGDAPDDYYIVHADPQTHEMRALTYIVSSPVLFADGGKSPEKLLSWLDPVSVGGLRFASRYQGTEVSTGTPTATVHITEIAIDIPVDDAVFAPPAGAKTGL